ncbi:MAG TPA: 30S ribosomal protein S1 [Rubricoccaceae bacterium]|nr:30S ribosomal protein S1 [Rubricoccaceae bacterium]
MAEDTNRPDAPEGATPETATAEADLAPEAAPTVDTPDGDSLLDRVKDTVGGVVETVTEKAAEAIDAAAEKVKDVAGSALETAGDAADRVKDTVSDVAETVTEKVGDAVGAVRERVSPTPTDTDAEGASVLTSVRSAEDLERMHPRGRLGYTGEIQGRTVTLAELEKFEQKQSGGDGAMTSDEDLRKLYETSLSEVAEGEIVPGRVVAITDKEIVVDIGFKSDGVVAKNEFEHEVEVGEEIEVYVDRLEDRRGQLNLSKTKADDLRRWRRIEEAFETSGILEGQIVRRIKGGMIVNLLGAEAFLPGSQVDVRPVRDFDTYLGKTMEFKVVKINPQNGNVVVSHKALIEKDLMEQRQQILDTLEVGQVLEGQVKNIVNFGVFVDLGGVDGLLHITDLSWGRVGHPSEVIELDQKLNVVVLDYDRERQRISLGLKQLQPHPWEQVTERYAEGQTVEGRVVSITDYGAFVELEKGIEGLVHISEMSWTEHVKHPTQRVQLGQMVEVKILKIDHDEKKISLGMKQLEPDPWEGLIERYPVGTVTRGKVRNLTTFGAFVEIEPGIDGLVHVSDLSWTKRVKHPGEIVKKGDELDVVVLDIDVAQRRISLGHKQVMTDPWQQYAQVYAEGTDTPGTVTEINDGGLVVELPLEAEGFVPASHLERAGKPSDSYQVGETLDLQVLRLDRDERVIVLSQTAKKRAAERAEREATRTTKSKTRNEERRAVEEYARGNTGPATLGELSGLAALRDQMGEAEAAAAGAPAVDAPAEEPAEPDAAEKGAGEEG